MKQIYKIGKSDDLNSSQAVLLIEVSESHCCFGIVDYANFMLVQAAYYVSEEADHKEMLRKLVDEHSELRQSFRQTVVGYYTAENVLVPVKFYKFEDTRKLLQATYEKGQNVVVTESLVDWQLYNVYYVPASLQGWLSRQFATGNFWHVYSVILKNPIAQNEDGHLMIDFKTENFSVVVTRNNALLLSQIFPYSKAPDVLYWLLKICQEFSLSRTGAILTLSGLIDKQSAVFKELYQYFLNITLASTENDIQLSGDFDTYPVHFFSSLYKLAVCVS